MSYQRFCLGRLRKDFLFLFKISFLFSFLLSFQSKLSAQTNYLMSLENGTQVNNNTFEFDVFIKSTGSGFTLTSYQCAFTFNAANNGGTLSFSYLSGSSQLTNIPSIAVGINQTDGGKELTFASNAGSDNISTTAKKVGRFRLQNSSAYTSTLFEITWNFQGVINTILTGSNFINITNPANHVNLVVNNDTTPPTLLSASASNSSTVILNFSEQITQTTAANSSNYSVNNGITVSSASLSSDGKTVTLTTSSHTAGLTYVVTANNIKDPAGNLISPTANSAQYLFEDSGNLRINVKIFLQGPYSNGVMKKSLNDSSFIPLNQPYNNSPWNFAGSENVQNIPPGVVDWVLIELRSGTASATIQTKRAAFIRTDGTLVDLDGTSKVKIEGVAQGSYYVVVRHRNHLAVMSATKITLSSDPSLYDFSTAANKAYGSAAQKNLGDGKYGLYSGDGNANGTINNSDANSVWKQENGKMGYYAGDFDMNCGVNIVDKNSYWEINSGKSTKVPN